MRNAYPTRRRAWKSAPTASHAIAIAHTPAATLGEFPNEAAPTKTKANAPSIQRPSIGRPYQGSVRRAPRTVASATPTGPPSRSTVATTTTSTRGAGSATGSSRSTSRMPGR
jgi:hypothetical protein